MGTGAVAVTFLVVKEHIGTVSLQKLPLVESA
jgi:hypothetical protein